LQCRLDAELGELADVHALCCHADDAARETRAEIQTASPERMRALADRFDRENDEVVRTGNLALDVNVRIARTRAEIKRCR
jgi:hypothetical protein